MLTPGLVGRAAVVFATTNVDDILVLALFFARAGSSPAAGARIVAGQYLGFAAIVAASIAGALGAGLLPGTAVRFLGLVPLALGLNAARRLLRDRGPGGDQEPPVHDGGPTTVTVAAVTLANGGDNIGVYVPVLARAGTVELAGYAAVFLVLVGVWCGLGRYLATRSGAARGLSRWGHVLLPAVLIGIGTAVLVSG